MRSRDLVTLTATLLLSLTVNKNPDNLEKPPTTEKNVEMTIDEESQQLLRNFENMCNILGKDPEKIQSLTFTKPEKHSFGLLTKSYENEVRIWIYQDIDRDETYEWRSRKRIQIQPEIDKKPYPIPDTQNPNQKPETPNKQRKYKRRGKGYIRYVEK
tara:strand:+ start:533 stop:1003 length:471 start_codon:yes stop_codon:yes gene_type:complete